MNNKEPLKWKTSYDSISDILYITREKLPKGAVLCNINDGYSVYITKKKKIVGIAIEYFSSETEEVLSEIKFIK